MDYYDTYLKHKYPYFDCRTKHCEKYVVIKEAMCSKCFNDKYPEMNDGKLQKCERSTQTTPV